MKRNGISATTAIRKARAQAPLECHYCGAPATTVDHIIPQALGGPVRAGWNRVPACRSCNAAKGSNWPTCACQKCQQALRLYSNYR